MRDYFTSFLFCLTILVSTTAIAEGNSPPAQPPLFPVIADRNFPDASNTFDEVRQLILDHYYTRTITEDALYQASIHGMLRHISPPQTPGLAALWPPETYNQVLTSLQGMDVSLGLNLSYNTGDGSLTVNSIQAGSPAHGKLQTHDRIMRINGKKLSGQSADTIKSMLNGKPGSKIHLTIIRDIQVLSLELILQKFQIKQVHSEVVGKQVGYIRLDSFAQDIHQEIHSHLQQLHDQGIRKLIIDLRNNSGGVFLEGLKVSELFLPDKSIVLRTLKRPEKIDTYVSGNKQPYDFQIIILTNRNTASASEIFAAALRAHGKAQLVGLTTQGKATMEQTFTLKNGYRIKFIVGALYDPRGRSWQGIGLQPDYYIEQPDDLHIQLNKLNANQRLQKDLQMATAWNLLSQTN